MIRIVLLIGLTGFVFGCGSDEPTDLAPLVEQVTPAQARVGERITLSGLRFGIGGPRDGVFIAAEPLPIDVWTNTSITVWLETEHLGHRLLVVHTDGQVSPPVPIEILPLETQPNSSIEIDD